MKEQGFWSPISWGLQPLGAHTLPEFTACIGATGDNGPQVSIQPHEPKKPGLSNQTPTICYDSSKQPINFKRCETLKKPCQLVSIPGQFTVPEPHRSAAL